LARVTSIFCHCRSDKIQTGHPRVAGLRGFGAWRGLLGQKLKLTPNVPPRALTPWSVNCPMCQ